MAQTIPQPKKAEPAPRRWLLILGGSLGLCLVAVLGWMIVDGLTFRPTGEIAYECDFPERPPQICLINANGDNQRTVSPIELGYSISPTWSPDGALLAFINWKDVPHRIYVYDMASQDVNTLQMAMSATDVWSRIVWSSNGNQLLLEATINNQRGLYAIDLWQDKSNPSLIQETLYTSANRPVYSRDGQQIYYTDVFQVTPGLSALDAKMYRRTLDGNDLEELTSICGQMAIHPNGEIVACNDMNKLVFRRVSDWSVSSEVSNWSISISGVRFPAWSPDGEYIVYSQTYWPGFMGDNNGELWIMRADGSRPTKITNGPSDLNPPWRPQP